MLSNITNSMEYKLETKGPNRSTPSSPTKAKSYSFKLPSSRPVVKTSIVSDTPQGQSTQEAYNANRILEINSKRNEHIRRRELEKPLDIAVDDHGSRSRKRTETLQYIASKGAIGRLESFLEDHPAFDRFSDFPKSERQGAQIEILREALLLAAERSHLANIRLLVTKYRSLIDLDHQYPDKHNNTAAMQANTTNKFQAVLLLIRLGADMEFYENEYSQNLLTMTPLQSFLYRSDSPNNPVVSH